MDLSQLDLNALPVWLTAAALVLYLSPRILKEFSTLVPPLARRFEAVWERQDALIHHRLDSEAANQAQQVRLQDRMLTILERIVTEKYEKLEVIEDELTRLKSQAKRTDGLIELQTRETARVADKLDDMQKSYIQLTERITNLCEYALERRKANGG